VPPGPPPRNLAWLLDATAGKNRRIDWRSGLGFTAPVKPASVGLHKLSSVDP
jgi:hypothetical protein